MRRAACLVVLLSGACGDGGGAQPPQPDANPNDSPQTFVHDFPDVAIPAGGEQTGLCQSWTLGNDEPLYVNEVDLEAGPGWHHSNWVFMSDDAYAGPDGVWPCSDRGFEEVAAGLMGGVLTAQSTQAAHGVQKFPDGDVIKLPAHARIIGDTHTLNTGDVDLMSHLSITMHTLPRASVVKELQPMSIVNHSIVLQPMASSIQSVTCDLSTLQMNGTGRPVDFKIYYVLPHYHALGTGFTLTASGGSKDGQVVYQTNAKVGESGGGTLDPPVDLTGATGLTMSCDYENPRPSEVRWGVGDQEMCVLLAFTDSEFIWAGGQLDLGMNTVVGQDQNGTWLDQAPCQLYVKVP
jgi:hypothetical protein